MEHEQTAHSHIFIYTFHVPNVADNSYNIKIIQNEFPNVQPENICWFQIELVQVNMQFFFCCECKYMLLVLQKN